MEKTHQKVITLEQAIESYCLDGRTAKKNVSLVREYLQKVEHRSLASLNWAELFTFRMQVIEQAGKAKANDTIEMIDLVIDHAIEEGNFDGPNPAEPYVTPYQWEALRHLLDNHRNHDLRDFTLLCIFTRASAQEVERMTLANVDFENKTWRLDKGQRIHLAAPAIQILSQRKEKYGQAESLFPNMDHPKHRKDWRDIIAKMGLHWRLTPWSIRESAKQWLVRL